MRSPLQHVSLIENLMKRWFWADATVWYNFGFDGIKDSIDVDCFSKFFLKSRVKGQKIDLAKKQLAEKRVITFFEF